RRARGRLVEGQPAPGDHAVGAGRDRRGGGRGAESRGGRPAGRPAAGGGELHPPPASLPRAARAGMTRVLSLLPAATEIVAALGAGRSLVGISHECDYPPSVLHLPRVTSTPVDAGRTGSEIDADVRRLTEAGHPVITVDAALV